MVTTSATSHAGALFGGHFVQNARASKARDADFDERIIFVEAGDDFLGIAQIGGRVESDVAFVPGIFD